MQHYEYKVVPAPRKGLKARGLKTAEDRFAHSVATIMNDQARDGWEYLRADTLPMEERKGLTGRTLRDQHLLVFRRDKTRPEATLTPMRATASDAPAPAAPSLGPARLTDPPARADDKPKAE